MKNKSVTFSIPEFLYEEFAIYCKQNKLNKSAIQRGLIYLYLKEKIENTNSPIHQFIKLLKNKKHSKGAISNENKTYLFKILINATYYKRS